MKCAHFRNKIKRLSRRISHRFDRWWEGFVYSRTVAYIACPLIGFWLGLSNQPCEAAKRRFTVPDDIALIHFGDPYTAKANAVTVSPDGQYFVVDTERGRISLN